MSNNEYIESRIKERTQVFDDDLFFADEFVIQTVHNPEASRINQVEVMRGSGEKIIQPSENDIIQLLRRSIIAKNDLKKGESLTLNDITWVRPSRDIDPGDENLIIGKKLIKDIKAGTLLNYKDFTD